MDLGSFHLPGYVAPVLLTGLPLAGALVLLALPAEPSRRLCRIALGFTVASFLASLAATVVYLARPVAPAALILGRMTGDGLVLCMASFVAFLLPLFAGFGFQLKEGAKDYLVFLLLIETGALGALTALSYLVGFFFLSWTLIVTLVELIVVFRRGVQRRLATPGLIAITLAGAVALTLLGIAVTVVLSQGAFDNF